MPPDPGALRSEATSTGRTKIIAAFAVIYLVWGSTFLATRIGVLEMPPMLFAAARFTIAGTLLSILALVLGERFPHTRREWLHAGLFSILMVPLSNGLSTVAVRHVPSNEAALLAAGSALWLAGLGAIGPRGHTLRGIPPWSPARIRRRRAAGMAARRRGTRSSRVACAAAPEQHELRDCLDRLPRRTPRCRPHGVQRDHHAHGRGVSRNRGCGDGRAGAMALERYRRRCDALSGALRLGAGLYVLHLAAEARARRSRRDIRLRQSSDCNRAWLGGARRGVDGRAARGGDGDPGRCGAGDLPVRTMKMGTFTISISRELVITPRETEIENVTFYLPIRSRRPFDPIRLKPSQETSHTITAAPIAVQNPEIVNPGTRRATRPTIAALSTKRNRPRVTSVRGSVRMKAIGRTTALMTPRSTAAIASFAGDSKRIPDSSRLATQSPSAEMAARSRNPTMACSPIAFAAMVKESVGRSNHRPERSHGPSRRCNHHRRHPVRRHCLARRPRPASIRYQGAGDHRARGLRALVPRTAEYAGAADRLHPRHLAVRPLRQSELGRMDRAGVRRGSHRLHAGLRRGPGAAQSRIRVEHGANPGAARGRAHWRGARHARDQPVEGTLPFSGNDDLDCCRAGPKRGASPLLRPLQARFDLAAHASAGEQLDQRQRKVDRGTGTARGDDPAVDHHRCVTQLQTRRRLCVEEARNARCSAPIEKARVREHTRRRADRGEVASTFARPTQHLDDPCVVLQMRRAWHPAGQYDHVERRLIDIPERRIGAHTDAMRADDGVGRRTQGGDADLDTGAPQQVDHGDRLDLLEPFREWDQDPGHRSAAVSEYPFARPADRARDRAGTGVPRARQGLRRPSDRGRALRATRRR